MSQQIVTRIRKFNRFYTNVLGLLNTAILDSPYSLSELRLLLEIDRMEKCTFARLSSLLNMDKGLASRQLKRLAGCGLVRKLPSPGDRRVEYLELTAHGQSVLSEMEAKSNGQIEQMICHLSDQEREELVQSMERVASALSSRGTASIREYLPDDVDYVIGYHSELYKRDYGFNSSFVDYVDKPVRAFHAHRSKREQMWIAELNNQRVGAIAVVQTEENTAQLRWFIVDPKARGRGFGSSLIKTALAFCRDAGYQKVILWTADMLKVSRRMYAAHGFTLIETKENTSWTGQVIHEEKWELDLRL